MPKKRSKVFGVMNIIVDASAVIAVIVEEDARPEILRLTAGCSLGAPLLTLDLPLSRIAAKAGLDVLTTA